MCIWHKRCCVCVFSGVQTPVKEKNQKEKRSKGFFSFFKKSKKTSKQVCVTLSACLSGYLSVLLHTVASTCLPSWALHHFSFISLMKKKLWWSKTPGALVFRIVIILISILSWLYIHIGERICFKMSELQCGLFWISFFSCRFWVSVLQVLLSWTAGMRSDRRVSTVTLLYLRMLQTCPRRDPLHMLLWWHHRESAVNLITKTFLNFRRGTHLENRWVWSEDCHISPHLDWHMWQFRSLGNRKEEGKAIRFNTMLLHLFRSLSFLVWCSA